jgi:transposase
MLSLDPRRSSPPSGRKSTYPTVQIPQATSAIRGQATEFKYERGVQPAPKLGGWVAVLTEILESEAKLPRRERRSTQRLFEELRGRGYDGAHDSVHRFVKVWRGERAQVPAQAFVPMSFAPGEAYQFYWSHETITLQGLPLMIKAAHMKLSHSRMPFVRTYFRETQELVFDAHDKAFVFDGGACRRGTYDYVPRHIIVEDLVRHAAQRGEGGQMTAEHGLQILMQDEARPDQAAVAEHEREQPDDPRLARLVSQHQLELGEVDLRLVARWRLEADLEWRAGRRPYLAQKVGHGGIATAIATLSDLPEQPTPRQPGIGRNALSNVGLERLEPPRPRLTRPVDWRL